MSLRKRSPGGLAKGVAERARARVTTLLVDDPASPFEARARQATSEVIREVMADDVRPADLVALAAEAAALAENLAAEARKMSPPERPVACRAGCAHCCHLSVAAAPAEVFRLAAHIRNRFSSAERAVLVERLRIAAAMSRDERLAAHLPCPLLKNDSCSVYEVRPLNCRGLESMDAEICRRAYLGEAVPIPVYAPRWLVYNRVLAGVTVGTEEAGHDGEQVDLSKALLIALENPDTARRWLAGDRLFEHCRLSATEAA
jgi:hypothetical protein